MITFFLLRFTEFNSIVLKSQWIIFIVPKRIYSGGGGGGSLSFTIKVK